MKRAPLKVGDKCRTGIMEQGDRRIWTVMAVGQDSVFGSGWWVDAETEDGTRTGRIDAPWFRRVAKQRKEKGR